MGRCQKTIWGRKERKVTKNIRKEMLGALCELDFPPRSFGYAVFSFRIPIWDLPGIRQAL